MGQQGPGERHWGQISAVYLGTEAWLWWGWAQGAYVSLSALIPTRTKVLHFQGAKCPFRESLGSTAPLPHHKHPDNILQAIL